MARGAQPTDGDYDGRTPLHLAASEGHADVVSTFIALGVPLAPKDRWGNTPLDDARRGGYLAIVTMLEQAARAVA